MAASDSSRSTILFLLSILLTFCQVITAVALIVLFKSFLKLKKRVVDYEKNLPLVRLETMTRPQRETTTVAEEKVHVAKPTGSSNQLQVGETAMRVPTPKLNRKSINACNADEQQVPANDCTMTVPRTLSTSGKKLHEPIHDVSFESFNSPRDSGTGSASTRSPQSSISFESQKMMKESFNNREGSSTLPKCRSQGSKPRDKADRTSSTASCGHPRPTLYGSHSAKFPNNKPLNDNDFRFSRLKTVSIEMVGLDDSGETKSKRASRALKEMEEDPSEEPSAIEDVGFDNEGYHGDHTPSNRSSSESSKKAPLASEESVSSFNSESLQLNNNEFEHLDGEEEKYVNQEIVDAMRYDSVGSSKHYSSKHNESVYVNQRAQP